MKIVITGALGHIGSYLLRNIGNRFQNCELVLIDNLLTQRFSSLFSLPYHSRYTFVEANVNHMNLCQYFKDTDVVIHLAAITDAAGSVDKAEEVEANNFLSTKAVAEACVKTNTRLIAVSSTSVYGTQSLQVDEDCSADDLRPQSPYAKTKLMEERLIRDFVKEQGLKAVHCRFGTIFGTSPGMRFHTAVNKFCFQASMGLPITVWRTALDQKRPYLDLRDAADAVYAIIERDIFDGEIYNVLTANFTVREVIDEIRKHRPDLEIAFIDNEIMNQLSYEVLNNKFISVAEAPRGCLARGIADTMELFKHFKKSNNLEAEAQK